MIKFLACVLLTLTACGSPPVVLPQTSAPVHFTVHAIERK